MTAARPLEAAAVEVVAGVLVEWDELELEPQPAAPKTSAPDTLNTWIVISRTISS